MYILQLHHLVNVCIISKFSLNPIFMEWDAMAKKNVGIVRDQAHEVFKVLFLINFKPLWLPYHLKSSNTYSLLTYFLPHKCGHPTHHFQKSLLTYYGPNVFIVAEFTVVDEPLVRKAIYYRHANHHRWISTPKPTIYFNFKLTFLQRTKTTYCFS